MFDDLDQLIHADPFLRAKTAQNLHLKEGERREVAILFADCHGFTALSERLDHETVHTLMDKLMQLFTSRIKHFGGFIDKYEGDLVMALFGAKVASEQDTERAIEAGLQMLAVLEQFNRAVSQRLGFEVNISVRIGINTGEVTTGKVGEKREGDFTVYGDAVNLASRIESNAPLNRIMLTKATMQKVLHAFDFEPHGDIQVKGKTESIDAWLVSGSKTERLSRWQVRWTAFVGRELEMARLQQKHEQVVARLESLSTPSISSTYKPIVVGLKGEAGMGKSRLIDEFLKQIGAESFYLHGTTPRLVQQAYGLFISMIRRQLGISPLDDQTVARQKLEESLTKLTESLDDDQSRARLQESLPLLGNLLNLPFDDVRLTLPPKDLQPHLQTAIRYFIEACAAKANKSGDPLVVVLEDLHWADSPSLATLEFLLFTLNLEEKRRNSELKQILFLLTYRPEYSPTRGILADSEYEEVELSTLTPELAQALIESIVRGRGSVSVSPETLDLVMERSSGNPFFIEEWASYIAESKVSVAPSSLPVPSTLQALILARMDQLEAELKLLLQKAAVLGRQFFVNVVEAMEERLEGRGDLGGNFSILEDNKFLLPVQGRSFSSYMFKHILTQEVAYGTLLIANRKVLHKIAGEVIEDLFADRLEEHWRDLAEHYEKGEVWEKAGEYLLKAAEQAKERFDNEAALDIFNRLIDLSDIHSDAVEPQAIIKAMLHKTEVLMLTGEWSGAQQWSERALTISEVLQDEHLIASSLQIIGEVCYVRGDYDNALENYQRCLTICEKLDDKIGTSRSVGHMGNVHTLRGEYDRAIVCYQRSLLIAEEIGDKNGISGSVGNLGKVFAAQGDYDRAMECYQRSLFIAEELGGKLRITSTLTTMGQAYFVRGEYDRAMEYYERSLAIAEEIGYKMGISSSAANIGRWYVVHGDHDRAMGYFQRSLTIAEVLGYKHGISGALNDLGSLFRRQKEFDKAMEYFQRSLIMAEELGHKRGMSMVLGNMGGLFCSQRNYDQAIIHYERCLSLAKELGDRRVESIAVGNMGNVFTERGEYAKAIECYEKRLSIAELMDDKQVISETIGNIGLVCFETGEMGRAEELLAKSVDNCRELKLKPYLAFILPTQARVALAQNKFLKAGNICAEALTLAQAMKNLGMILQAQTLSHKINFLATDDAPTRTTASESLTALLEQGEEDELSAEIHYELVAMHRTLNHSDQAEHHRLEAISLYESLYVKTPKFAFKKRLEELESLAS